MPGAEVAAGLQRAAGGGAAQPVQRRTAGLLEVMKLQGQAAEGCLPLVQQLAQADGAEQRTQQRGLGDAGVLRAGCCPHRRNQQQAEAVLLGAAGEAQDGAGADLLAVDGFLEGVPARAGRGHVETQRQLGDAARYAEQQWEVAVAGRQGLQVAGVIGFAQPEAAADQGLGVLGEGVQLRVGVVGVELQQRRPGQRQVVAQQGLGVLLELGAGHLAGVLEQAAHAVEVALALLQACVQAGEALLGQMLELVADMGLAVLPELAGQQCGESQANQGQQATEQPLAASAAAAG
ncbi:hypothetical protein D3C80_829980 [compost metagenome]